MLDTQKASFNAERKTWAGRKSKEIQIEALKKEIEKKEKQYQRDTEEIARLRKINCNKK